MSVGGCVLAATGKTWSPESYEMQQLSDLNAMERQQDTNLWASSAIYLAANGVLLVAVAAVSGSLAPLSVLAAAGIGIFGLILTYVWWITAERAYIYEIHWIERAKALQRHVGLPDEFAVWSENRPPGPSARNANRLLRLSLFGVWAIITATSMLWLVVRF
ncbi:MAG: hypothetical protein A3K65_09425 [Euryarchaeota archaeon RBG_16_68_12]|nr:MAG: hypothetical protein A3K65_09425 [Euryarchaeota archaeon RBG_16_68_12]